MVNEIVSNIYKKNITRKIFELCFNGILHVLCFRIIFYLINNFMYTQFIVQLNVKIIFFISQNNFNFSHFLPWQNLYENK